MSGGIVAGCARCGTIKPLEKECAVCPVLEEHDKGCALREAVATEMPKCIHGRRVCKDACDACTCGAYSRRLRRIEHAAHFVQE